MRRLSQAESCSATAKMETSGCCVSQKSESEISAAMPSSHPAWEGFFRSGYCLLGRACNVNHQLKHVSHMHLDNNSSCFR